MQRRVKLEQSIVHERVAVMPGWTVADGKLRRELQFDDFVSAFGFMASLALVAQSRDHHPDWTNVYARVVVQWGTHDSGGITELDFDLAAETDRLARIHGR